MDFPGAQIRHQLIFDAQHHLFLLISRPPGDAHHIIEIGLHRFVGLAVFHVFTPFYIHDTVHPEGRKLLAMSIPGQQIPPSVEIFHAVRMHHTLQRMLAVKLMIVQQQRFLVFDSLLQGNQEGDTRPVLLVEQPLQPQIIIYGIVILEDRHTPFIPVIPFVVSPFSVDSHMMVSLHRVDSTHKSGSRTDRIEAILFQVSVSVVHHLPAGHRPSVLQTFVEQHLT